MEPSEGEKESDLINAATLINICRQISKPEIASSYKIETQVKLVKMLSIAPGNCMWTHIYWFD